MPRELPDGCAREIAVSSRLNSFSAQPQGYDWKYGPRDPRDMLHRAESVKGLHYVSLNYPEHFPQPIEKEMTKAVLDSKLKVSTINLRYFPGSVYPSGQRCAAAGVAGNLFGD